MKGSTREFLLFATAFVLGHVAILVYALPALFEATT